MKKYAYSGFTILLVIGVLYIIYLRECRGPAPGPPDGYVLVEQSAWDSICDIDTTPRIVSHTDTLIMYDTVYVYGKPVPPPVEVGEDTNMYYGWIVNDSINVWVDIMVQGLLLSWDWRYNPVTKKIETITERRVPVPVNVETPIYKRELFLSAVGGGGPQFGIGADLDLVTKQRNMYGVQYRRIGDDNFYFFKVGIKLKFFDK